jgi:Mg/Co/Ni transporter MgtE
MTTWIATVDIKRILAKKEKGASFEYIRDEVVKKLKTIKHFQEGDIAEVVEELADTDTVEQFDCVLDIIYDFADARKIWMGI